MVSCEGDAARVRYYFEDQGDYFAGKEDRLNPFLNNALLLACF